MQGQKTVMVQGKCPEPADDEGGDKADITNQA